MADNPVALDELNVMADYFCDADYPYFEELREAMKLLRHTGCRIQEIFNINRWWVVSGYQVQMQPQKGNNPRTIILNSDFDNFLAAINGQYSPFLGRTYSQLQYLFSKINPYGKIYSGTKEITMYFFRYLYLRTLQADGLTVSQIASEMGYTSTTAVSNYLEAELTSTIEVPVESSFVFDGISYPTVEIDGKLWTTENLRFNDSGSGVLVPGNSPPDIPLLGYNYSRDALLRIISNIPDGWRIPVYADISSFKNFLLNNAYTGFNVLSTNPNAFRAINGNDSLGLSLVGNGYDSTYFKMMATFWVDSFWSSTKNYYVNVHYTLGNFYFSYKSTSYNNHFGIRFCQDI